MFFGLRWNVDNDAAPASMVVVTAMGIAVKI
jgi:hypothetical protein